MRNLKRVLSLSLASVMLMGMMVIGAGAAQSTAKGYPDVDKDVHNIEAIDVLQTVEVMIGYTEEEGGGFQPDKPVTRAEMMVIMGKLLNFDYNYYAAICPFTDVPDWAKGWVGAAYANKVAVGRGDGIFDPDSPVTAVEASAFLMRALGYFQYSNDYAAGFEAATVLQGSNIGIYKGVSSSASEPMTRNQVAKMVLNTLESGMVQPDGNTINLTTPDGSVLTGKVNYVYVTSSKAFATSIHDTQATAMGSSNSGYIVEMGEQLYDGMLKLYDGRLDDFGRPSRHWEYDGKAIGTYIKYELLKQAYTTKVTGKQLYELLGADVIKDYEFTIKVDGETKQGVLDHDDITSNSTNKDDYYFNTETINRTNTNQVGGTGNGVLTQVFIDGDKKEVYISVINTYLAKADADYNSSRDEASFTIWNIREVSDPENPSYKALVKDSGKPGSNTKSDREVYESNRIVYSEDFEGKYDVKGVKSGDIVLVHVAENEIKEILIPETIDETGITAFKTDSYVVTDVSGQIDYAHTAMYNPDVLWKYSRENMKDYTYRIFLDPYGYLIGLEEVEAELHYVFLTGINSSTENLRDQTAIGNVVFLDGTSANVTINMKNSKNDQGNGFVAPSQGAYYDAYGVRVDTKVTSLMNTWCTYSVDDNGVYTLKEVGRQWYGDNGFAEKGIGQSHMGGTYMVSGDTVNTWYYTNGSNSPLTSNFVSAAVKAIGGGSPNYDKASGADEEYWKISKSYVSMTGILDPACPWKVVYGNNDTVYLTAEVEYLSGAKNVLSKGGTNTGAAVVITGAESVAVGVQDVDMSAMNAQAVLNNLVSSTDRANAITKNITYVDISDGVYALFDDDGYVIAAMVVGADDGANTSYAWVSSGNLSREGLVNGKWEYSRDVIIDGQKVTLTETESNGTEAPDIGRITSASKPNHDPISSGFIGDQTAYWWKVKTKADGTVKEATRIKFNGEWDNTSNVRYIYDIKDDVKPVNWTSILNQSFGITTGNGFAVDTDFVPYDTTDIDSGSPTYTIRVAGNTLQVEGSTGSKRGYAVKENATVVLVKDEEVIRNGRTIGYNWKGDIQYYANNRNGDGLKQAVNRLGSNDDFVGYISALLVDGRAEWLVIYDKTRSQVGNQVNSGGPTNYIYAQLSDTDDSWIYVMWDDTDARSPYKISGKAPGASDQENAILTYMIQDKGWTDVTIEIDRTQSTATVKFSYLDTQGRRHIGSWKYAMMSY